MKSTINLFLSIGLLLGLCNCGGSKHQTAQHKRSHKKIAQVNLPIIGNNLEASETLAFNEDINSFEDLESFVLEENNDFGSFTSSDLDDGTLALNDPNNISFSWEALKEEAQTTFKTVYFDYDTANVSQKEHSKVVKNAEQAKKAVEEGKTVVCKGKSCKWGGTEVYNLALSDQRAQSVARELKASGVDENHIKAFGVGTKESVALGSTKEAHAHDRCVELYTLTI